MQLAPLFFHDPDLGVDLFPPSSGINASTTIVCSSAQKDQDFAGEVHVYVSLNGVDFADTNLTFTYYRKPRISSYTPHGGPVACTDSAVEGGTASLAEEHATTRGVRWNSLHSCAICHVMENMLKLDEPIKTKLVSP